MDEEKQNNGLMKKAGDSLKQGAKKLAKEGAKQVFKKVITAILPILLKVLIPVIIVVVIITGIVDLIHKITSLNSKEANAFAVYYTGESTGTETEGEEENIPDNRIIVDFNNVTDDGAYILTYEFKDEEGNIIEENDAIENIKKDLVAENKDLNVKLFSDSELKVIGVLMYNGLSVEDYNEDELKALVTFLKADIASQSIDLRDEDSTPITVEELRSSDEIYGTLEIWKTSTEENGESKQEKLKYISYEEFSSLVEEKSTDAINKFTIDEKGNLVVAKWSSTITTYNYLYTNGSALSNADRQRIPEECLLENEDETFIIPSQPINYKQAVKGYILNYAVLSDLLITTQNAQFCEDIAQLAFDSKIVINVREEKTVNETEGSSTFTQTTLLYDYVKYEVSGRKEDISYGWTEIANGSSSNTSTPQFYGWSSGMTPTSSSYSGSEMVKIYTWWNSFMGKQYKLNLRTTSGWWLYEYYRNVSSTELETQTHQNPNGDLIDLENKHVTEEYDEYTIDEDYTDDEIFTFVRTLYSKSVSHAYKFELSEVDTWYTKYLKEYEEEIESEVTNTSYDVNNKGNFPQDFEVLQEPTSDSSIINGDEHVKDFIEYREDKYKDDHPGAIDIECNITSLEIKQKSRIEEVGSYSTTTTRYKFDEEAADATEATVKNVEYINNKPVYTAVDAEGNSVEGFLSIYDKYRSNNVDLYLQNDAEKSLFTLLEQTSENVDLVDNTNLSNIFKYLLYVYDGIDRGVTDLKITIVDIDGMNRVTGSALENYIKAWENSGLWRYETGQSSQMPLSYITADEAYYIVYEDGSAGHNNIAYGWATFISSSSNARVTHPQYGKGYYNWKEEFLSEGIIVEDLYKGAYVDKAAADAVFSNSILPRFENTVENYLTTYLSEYEFSRTQKDALISIAYQYGNISGFSDAYRNCLKEDGTVDAERIRTKYSRFNYSSTVNDRKYANWLLFTQGIYIDRSGNEIVSRMSLDGWEGEYYASDLYTFPVYKQSDPRWGSYLFGGPNGRGVKTISSSGCGCCSLACIVSGYTGQLISPDVMTDALDKRWPSGWYYAWGEGSNFYYDDTELLSYFGCTGKRIQGNYSAALEALENGYAVVGGCKGHLLAFVPTNSEDRAKGYIFRIIDSAYSPDPLCRDWEDAKRAIAKAAPHKGPYIYVNAIIYPPGVDKK